MSETPNHEPWNLIPARLIFVVYVLMFGGGFLARRQIQEPLPPGLWSIAVGLFFCAPLVLAVILLMVDRHVNSWWYQS